MIIPELVELNKSRGIENQETKNFMRFTVILADILIFIPSLYFVIFELYKNHEGFFIY
jgi:hypothetical protein